MLPRHQALFLPPDLPDPIGGPLEEYQRIGTRMWQIIQPLAEEFTRK